jgi:hypothetical protein
MSQLAESGDSAQNHASNTVLAVSRAIRKFRGTELPEKSFEQVRWASGFDGLNWHRISCSTTDQLVRAIQIVSELATIQLERGLVAVRGDKLVPNDSHGLYGEAH